MNTSDLGIASNTGLFELTVGKNGVKGKIGTGGTNLSIGNVLGAIQGGKASAKSSQVRSYVSRNFGTNENVENSLRSLYGFGDERQNKLLNDILKGDAKLVLDDEAIVGDDGKTENAQTVLEDGKRVIHLSREAASSWQLGGITLGHEAYRDGVISDKEAQTLETRKAVGAHTDMTKRMLSDGLYTQSMLSLIDSNQNLQMDLIASSLGKDVFNSYIDGTYDSSADYWKLTVDGKIEWDGSKDLNVEYYNEWGNKLIKKKYIEDTTGSFSQSLLNYVGEERALQILEQALGKPISGTNDFSDEVVLSVTGMSAQSLQYLKENRPAE